METINKTTDIVLIKLLKEPFVKHTATSLAGAVNLTRQGLWKIIYKLEENKMIVSEPISKTKKSTIVITLNWKNPITIKTLSLLLTKEALEYERWLNNFTELETASSFIILFGSILNNPKEANDIDILAIVKNKKNFKSIDKIILKIQKTQLKKIHLTELTKEEFIQELRKQNSAYLDALKKGIVLFGQDNYTKSLKDLMQI
ncbi:nucleotidyltransferase domain-containing protein [Candidatus Pacearchaeota archaeon]|nr:nucleotidyltransferase domain-containing protein [Candidatus Pacearchaeota archaeon]